MNIPADCVYEWLAGLFPSSLIYRFHPPGSKDIDNLEKVDDRYQSEALYQQSQFVKRVPVICNDQEPLEFARYNLTSADICQWWQRRLPQHLWPILQKQQHKWQILSRSNLGAVAQPNASDKFVLLHSERGGRNLELYQDVAVPAFWWSHALLARDWYRFAGNDMRLKLPYDLNFARDFNIYARSWTGSREYRLTFLSLVKAAKLLGNSHITFDHFDSGNHFSNHVFANKEFFLDTSLGVIPSSTIMPTASATYDPSDYTQNAIDVVLETIFDQDRIHLTEKVLRPIACGKPFLLMAPRGSLQYLKSYGFETFSGLMDESYDMIDDPVLRMQALIREMQMIVSLSPQKKKQLFAECHDIARRNQKHFFHDDFMYTICDEAKHNVNVAIEQVLKHHQSGTLLKKTLQHSDSSWQAITDHFAMQHGEAYRESATILHSCYKTI